MAEEHDEIASVTPVRRPGSDGLAGRLRLSGSKSVRVSARTQARNRAIQSAINLTETQVGRLRLLLRVFVVGMGTGYMLIGSTFVMFGRRLSEQPSSSLVLLALPAGVWALLFLFSGTLLILSASSRCASWKRSAIVVGACLAFWLAAAFAYSPIVNHKASPLLSIMFLMVAFNFVLGSIFARVQAVAHQAEEYGIAVQESMPHGPHGTHSPHRSQHPQPEGKANRPNTAG
jgi:hypothetical protein